MAVEKPMEGMAVRESGASVRGRAAMPQRHLVPRIRREVESELVRVRATTRLLEAERVGSVGYLALLLAFGVNAWGSVTYKNRHLAMWVVASLSFSTTYWLLPMIYDGALTVYRRKESGSDSPGPGGSSAR